MVVARKKQILVAVDGIRIRSSSNHREGLVRNNMRHLCDVAVLYRYVRMCAGRGGVQVRNGFNHLEARNFEICYCWVGGQSRLPGLRVSAEKLTEISSCQDMSREKSHGTRSTHDLDRNHHFQ